MLPWRHQIVFNGLIIVICRPHDPTITAVLSVWPLDWEFSLLFTRSEVGSFMCIEYSSLIYMGLISTLLWKTRQWWSCTSPKATTAGPGFEPGISWRCHGILEYSLDSHAESPGSNLTIAATLLSFSKAIYPRCCSRPRCIYKCGPGRMRQIIVFEFASAIITGCYTKQGMLPGEWKLCTVSAALK